MGRLIITIGRQYGSGGRKLGKSLRNVLQYRFTEKKN